MTLESAGAAIRDPADGLVFENIPIDRSKCWAVEDSVDYSSIIERTP